ncbi:uncharacterized protein LOC110709553 [Chenopodium quinoa]|uniref:uncharacterized protein LOC110709553 n=1 Tax=Chenopodium quinoa TaxID=63459 RepID=UPI000B792097|nr:uncharacterized protein LOC110709553 [Chenopodium quinoa]
MRGITKFPWPRRISPTQRSSPMEGSIAIRLEHDHVSDLRETPGSLRKYGMRLNPKKCVFGVKGGKCLGFLIDKRGIEAHPDKIQAVLDMQSPRSVKELVSPFPKEALYLYLAVFEHALSAVLVVERERVQYPVYFISHALRREETRYSMIEKLVYALVIASRKLKPYFHAHPVTVLTKQPIRKIIEGRNHSNRMTEWANQLSNYGLEYEPRRVIKAQALADLQAKWFLWHEGKVYKKSYTHPLLYCVSPDEGDYILREIHQGACGSHQGSRTLAGKSFGQRNADIPRLLATNLAAILPTLPFDKWGRDLLGPFPPAVGQKKFLIIVVDYFTRWVKAEALSTITEHQVQQFIWNNIITRFGVPRVLISDNGRQFDSASTKEYCNRFRIQNQFTSINHPQCNGQAKAANKVALRGIKTKLEGAKGTWLDELPSFLWSTRTTVKESTGRTPFSLVYGGEAVLPVEVGIPYPRITYYDSNANEELKSLDLDLLPEMRGNALLKSISYKQKITRYLNSRVTPCPLMKGDWVLRKLESTGHDLLMHGQAHTQLGRSL